MFPFQQSYDLGFGTPTSSQGYQAQDDPITDFNLSENKLISFAVGINEREATKSTDLGKQKESSKKAMHREVERKRRQEMSQLYASLRSLLPDYQIKGKRGVCDHIQVAESHIKRMEKNIQELRTQRNKLKSLLNYSSSGNEESSNGRDNNVKINIVSDGMEILISHSIGRSDLGLSRVLAELQRSDVDVVSSVSTRMSDRFVHKIQVKALDVTNVGALVLQERLSKAIM